MSKPYYWNQTPEYRLHRIAHSALFDLHDHMRKSSTGDAWRGVYGMRVALGQMEAALAASLGYKDGRLLAPEQESK